MHQIFIFIPEYMVYELVLLLVIVVVVAVALMMAAPPSFAGGGESDPDDDSTGDKITPDVPAVVDPRYSQSIKYTDRDTGREMFIKNKLTYAPPNSDRQISTLFHRGDPMDRAHLAILLSMIRGLDPWDRRIYSLRDSQIYAKIQPRQHVAENRARRHAENIYRVFARTFRGEMPKNPKYLDIGCMDGSITAELGALFSASDVHCVEPMPRGTAPAGVKITTEVARYPFPDDTFDIVTAIMSLHHIPDLEKVIPEIIRVIKPGGYLYIKDHDLWSPSDCALVDIEHAIHMTLSGEIAAGRLLPPDYYIQYRNYHEFDKIFAALQFVRGGLYNPNDRYIVLPTRAFWAIYKKTG